MQSANSRSKAPSDGKHHAVYLIGVEIIEDRGADDAEALVVVFDDAALLLHPAHTRRALLRLLRRLPNARTQVKVSKAHPQYVQGNNTAYNFAEQRLEEGRNGMPADGGGVELHALFRGGGRRPLVKVERRCERIKVRNKERAARGVVLLCALVRVSVFTGLGAW